MPLRSGFRSVWLDAKINSNGNLPRSLMRSFFSGAFLHGMSNGILFGLAQLVFDFHPLEKAFGFPLEEFIH